MTNTTVEVAAIESAAVIVGEMLRHQVTKPTTDDVVNTIMQLKRALLHSDVPAKPRNAGLPVKRDEE